MKAGYKPDHWDAVRNGEFDGDEIDMTAAQTSPTPALEGEAFLDPTGRIVNVTLTRGYLRCPPESASLGCKVVPALITVDDGTRATLSARVAELEEALRRISSLADTLLITHPSVTTQALAAEAKHALRATLSKGTPA